MLTTGAVSLSRAQWYLSPEIPPIMKKPRRYRVCVIGIFIAFASVIGPSIFTTAAEKKEARVTQVVHNVQLLAPNAAARSASLNDDVGQGTAIRTGSDSRAELTFTDRMLTRLGANTVVSFGEEARDFDLANGSILFYVPKSSGDVRINTAAATVAGTSFTAMVEYHPKSWLKFIVLEGHGSVSLPYPPRETRKLHAGQMIMVRPGTTKLPEPQDVDLSKLIKTSLLINKFPALPNVKIILTEANNQQISLPSSHVVDPTGLDTRDQRAAAERERTPKLRFNR
jgi:mannose-6-phosphate isomerase-like protein (cupin superfamily)